MVRVLGRELFVVYLRLRALPSLRFQVSNQNGSAHFVCLHEQGSSNGKRNARRTAHRQPHQGGTQQARAQHHLACRTTWLLPPKRLQNLLPQMDLHRFAAENLRYSGLRFLQVLFGLQKRQETRTINIVLLFPPIK